MNFSRMPRVSDFTDPVKITEKQEAREDLRYHVSRATGPRTVHTIGHIRQAIAHRCDGPITPFVLISRAARIASDRRAFNAEDVANALHEELLSRGWIVDEDDAVEETES